MKTIILSVLLLFLCNSVCGVLIKLSQSDTRYSADGQYNKTYYLSPDKANFFLAHLSCLSAGLELASVTTVEESASLNKLLSSVLVTPGWENGYWLSGSAIAYNETLEYHWFSTGEKIIYFNWGPGEPNNVDGNESCIEILLTSGYVPGWNDLSCMANLRYICQTRHSCYADL
ncbi:C-type lectin 37Db-like [Sitophilus oryzae]|uniref:C-type lectin 37Db-like n=1 Tax=Sitophilus oryzae TaxID=7048 RepID=A0A6J2XIU2_SITOR|nr:C-type lectin 37Db-like [Sitophilus oryzae]